jgi:hypothetical protein
MVASFLGRCCPRAKPDRDSSQILDLRPWSGPERDQSDNEQIGYRIRVKLAEETIAVTSLRAFKCTVHTI